MYFAFKYAAMRPKITTLKNAAVIAMTKGFCQKLFFSSLEGLDPTDILLLFPVGAAMTLLSPLFRIFGPLLLVFESPGIR